MECGTSRAPPDSARLRTISVRLGSEVVPLPKKVLSVSLKLELKNFRAFDDQKPACWELTDGFVAFVGVNNSGKSSLLRFFHEARNVFTAFAEPSNNRGATEAMFSGNRPEIGFQSVADVAEVYCNRNTRDMTATFSLAPLTDQREVLEPSSVCFQWHRPTGAVTAHLEVEGLQVDFQDWAGNLKAVQVTRGQRRFKVDLSRYQSAFDDLARAMYLGPFRNAVNMGGAAEYYDLQIGEQFIAAWDQYKTGNNRAHNRAAIAVERQLQGIFGLEKLEINAAPGNATLQIIADDEPYQLQEQGAGLAQFILVMAFVATRRPSYILIDEPELNLHPSLQLDFLTTLASHCERGVAFATHSLGLARSVGQNIYSVQASAGGGREVRPLAATRDYAQFLGELSLSGYTELGFSKVLLVEGTTEVPTLQRWLRLYGIEHEVVLLPLGGASLINANSSGPLAEISRITSDVYVIIDSERKSAQEELGKDRQGFIRACQDLGFRTHTLERRALENYFTDAAVKAIKGDKYRALGTFEALTDVQPTWSKNENWRIAAEMTRDDLDATDIGAFLALLQKSADTG